MKINTLDTLPEELDTVALEAPQATFYHSRVWLESVAAAYPHLRSRCLVAEDGGAVVGYLPFFLARKGPVSRAWSLPFGTYGGPVALEGDAIGVLLDAYARLLRRAGVVEVGWVDFGNLAEAEAWNETHLVDLTVGFDHLYQDAFAVQRRQRTRRAQRLGVTVRRSREEADLHAYFEIFRAKIEGFGRDNLYPESLYRELFARGGDSVRLYVAEHEDKIVGGHLRFHYKDTVIAWYGVVAKEHERLQAGTLLYTECMRAACEEGYATYNLGASLGKRSLIHFKESLGGVAYRYPVHVSRSVLGRLAARVKRAGGPR
jgi:CelD/BcsL family acetyltransferase involved in cellulose biosynthesis